MVTKIELGTHFQGKVFSSGRELVACLPDEEGEHILESGEVVVLSFERNTEQNYRFVRIGIENLPQLQKRGVRKDRLVNVSNDGKGMIILSDKKVLYVSTGAKLEQFNPI